MMIKTAAYPTRVFSTLSYVLVFQSLMSSAGAAVLAYDGFDVTKYRADGGYADPSAGPSNALIWDADTTPGGSVGQNPAMHGFVNNQWTPDGTNMGAHVYGRLENTQASYTGLSTSFGQLNMFRSSGSGGNKSYYRELSVGPSTQYPSTIYIAALVQRTSETTLSLSFTSTNGSDVRPFNLQILGSDGTYSDGTLRMAGVQSTGGSAEAFGDGLITPDTMHLLVFKIENSVLNSGSTSNGDQISLYLNPDLSSEAANSAALTMGNAETNFFVAGNSSWTLGGLQIESNLALNGQSVIFDEFRIATTWEDMVNAANLVPEPSTTALSFLLGLPLVLRRRR
ncbi:MAG: PEP-CTERM sorting domain-containing protein [Verrucomicrobiales bacterium]